METANLETCETCFRPLVAAGSQPRTQWKSFCRCNQAYSTKSQFSIDICGNCKKRVGVSSVGKAACSGLCSCSKSNPKKALTYIKQNESDSVAVDLSAAGIAADSFPTERFLPIGILGDSPRAAAILCRDKQRGTKVAVKCFKKMAPDLRSAFESEVRKNKELNHTSIAKVVDFGFHNNKSPYLVTEYKDGFDLEQCLALHGTPSPDVVSKILIAVCESLIYAQTQSVMHRDLRPGNVLFIDDMNSEPSIAVLDFALPKIKASEGFSEKLDAQWMSADEARNLDFNEKSEVYSIGLLGYALLTGQAPFLDGTALDIKNSHALKLPPRISTLNFDNNRPKDLEEVIEKCLEKDPRYRFDTVSALLERLQVFPRREQQKIAGVVQARSQKKMLMIAAVVLVVVALGAGGYFAFGHH